MVNMDCKQYMVAFQPTKRTAGPALFLPANTSAVALFRPGLLKHTGPGRTETTNLGRTEGLEYLDYGGHNLQADRLLARRILHLGQTYQGLNILGIGLTYMLSLWTSGPKTYSSYYGLAVQPVTQLMAGLCVTTGRTLGRLDDRTFNLMGLSKTYRHLSH